MGLRVIYVLFLLLAYLSSRQLSLSALIGTLKIDLNLLICFYLCLFSDKMYDSHKIPHLCYLEYSK